MNDEGLADVEAAIPFRLPRLHPGIRARFGAERAPVPRQNLIRLAQRSTEVLQSVHRTKTPRLV